MNPQESKSKPTLDEEEFRQRIVQLILLKRDPERAVAELSSYYHVERPTVRIGLPKGEGKALGCYVRRNKTIYLADTASFYNPYVVIHEFYHHLRSVSGKHRGTERHARDFALSFLRSGSPQARTSKS